MSNPVYPQNDWTRMIERVRERNATGGPREAAHVDAGDMPRVRSAAMGPVPAEPPLSEAEKADLDAKAIALGIMPNDTSEKSDAGYTSQEEALAAGESVERPQLSRPVEHRVTAREHTAQIEMPRIPNFRNVQLIDLKNGLVFVDGMSFAMHHKDVAKLCAYAVDLAYKAVQQAAEAARNELTAALNAQIEGPAKEADNGEEEKAGEHWRDV